MNVDCDLFIPKVSPNVDFYVFDENQYVAINSKLGYRTLINKQLYEFVVLIDNEKNLNQIVHLYNLKFDTNLEVKDTYDFLHKELLSYGIIKIDNVNQEKKTRDNYLKYSFNILDFRHFYFLVLFFRPLFKIRYFFFIFLSLFLILSITISIHFQIIYKYIADISLINIFYIFILTLIIGFFHEIGHASAAYCYGIRSGGIGFGFYLLAPVFYADVSDSWSLKAKYRVVIDLGGIFLEMLISLIVIVLFYITKNINFLVVPSVLLIHTIFELNPLIRTDGYWVLSDILNIPNLKKNSQTLFLSLLSYKNNVIVKFRIKEYSLCIYAFFSYVYVSIFLILMLFFSSNSILKYPKNIFSLFAELLHHPYNVKFISAFNLLLPTLFYILFIRNILLIFKKSKK